MLPHRAWGKYPSFCMYRVRTYHVLAMKKNIDFIFHWKKFKAKYWFSKVLVHAFSVFSRHNKKSSTFPDQASFSSIFQTVQTLMWQLIFFLMKIVVFWNNSIHLKYISRPINTISWKSGFGAPVQWEIKANLSNCMYTKKIPALGSVLVRVPEYLCTRLLLGDSRVWVQEM